MLRGKSASSSSEAEAPTVARLRFLSRWARLQLSLLELQSELHSSPEWLVQHQCVIINKAIAAGAPWARRLTEEPTQQEHATAPMSVIAHLLNKQGMAALVRATNDYAAVQWRKTQGPCDDDLRTWQADVLPTLAALSKLAEQDGGEGFEAPTAESLDVAAWSERFLNDNIAEPARSPLSLLLGKSFSTSRPSRAAKSFKAESWQSCSEGFRSPIDYEEPPQGAEHEHDHGDLSDEEGDIDKRLSQLRMGLLGANAGSDPALWDFARGAAEHGWSEADATEMFVRGPTYIEDKVKEQSASSIFEIVHVDMFTVKDPGGYPHVSLAPGGVVQSLRKRGEARFLFVVNFCMEPLQLAIVFAAKNGSPGELLPRTAENGSPAKSLIRRFVEDMSDQERSARFKVIPWAREAPWVVRTAVGRTPAIIGKKLKIDYFHVPRDHFEVSVDIFSSPAAKRVLGLLQGAAKVLAMEVFFVLEAKEAEELPECILGGFGIRHGDLSRTRGPI